MTDSLLRREDHDGHIAVLTIDRPTALNALNPEVLAALDRAFARCAAEGVRQVVLTGAGSKAFVAGADIAAMAELSAAQAEQFAREGQEVLDRIAAYPGVVIAAVNGFALGGGLELAMACDLIVAGANARFGQPEVGLGVIPGFGGTQRLVRLVGLHRARELVLTGRTILADEALRLGLVLEVTAVGEVVARALQIAALVGAKGPVAVRLAKEALATAPDGTLQDGLRAEASLFGRCFTTADQREGMAAFLGKRAPAFTGS